MPRGDLTPSALRRHDGSNRALPILLAAKGVVYDVTRGRDFYGAGGAYNLFTGGLLARAREDEPRFCGRPWDVSDLTADELKTLDDCEVQAKYPAVGRVVDDDDDAPRDDGSDRAERPRTFCRATSNAEVLPRVTPP